MKAQCNVRSKIASPFFYSFWYFLIVFVTTIFPVTYAQKWVPVGNVGFSDSIAHPHLAIDSKGALYVAYFDEKYGERATVKKFDGINWVTVGTEGFTTGAADIGNIAIGKNDTPYIVFSDWSDSGKATVMKYSGASWVYVGSPAFSIGYANHPSVAFSNNGTPYVAYQEYYSTLAIVKKYNGSNWVTIDSSGLSTVVCSHPAIAISENGTPYLAYEDASFSYAATVMKYDSSHWVIVGSPGFSPAQASAISITIDKHGSPYVTFQDGIPVNGKATVMKYDGSTWVYVVKPDFSCGSAEWITMALDTNGTPYVAYQDCGWGCGGCGATVMKYDSSDWSVVGKVGFSALDVFVTEIAIDQSGRPYVSYRDEGNSGRATVMKLDTGTYEGVYNTFYQKKSTIVIHPNPNRGAFTIHLSADENKLAQIVITNVLGQKVKELYEKTNATAEVQLDIPPGVYFVSASLGQKKEITKIIIQ